MNNISNIKNERSYRNLTKKQIKAKAIELRNQGRLYDVHNEEMEDYFSGSIDRFCDIAWEIRNAKRILDVGCGQGVLLLLLNELGHECYGLDIAESSNNQCERFAQKNIQFQVCNIEVDSLPYPDGFFDAAVCCQVLEHFTHSHLWAIQELHRVLRKGGIIEIDVPNVVDLRNRSRILRGKNITWDYEKHYLLEKPILYKGLSFYPHRHNREFTKNELKLLLEAGCFKKIRVSYLKSRRYRVGLERIMGIGSAMRDLIHSFRKSLISFAVKE
jgi:ubiquinone/menaquinone biosynthesis C-methylase UbiE